MATKTKIYGLLIIVGLAALAVDRCYLGASAPASSLGDEGDAEGEIPADESQNVPPARITAPSPPEKLSVPELTFPRRLPDYDPAIELRDIFARPGADGSGDQGHPSKSDSAKKEPQPVAIGREAFQAAHRVDAVMVQESLKIAVIDGRWMRVGDALDACTLTRIEGDIVIFQCHDGDAELSPTGKRRPPPG